MTVEELQEIEAAWSQGQEYWLSRYTSDPVVPRLTAALREAWKATEQAELWRECGIAEWQGAVATLTAENEQLQARIAELEGALVRWLENCGSDCECIYTSKIKDLAAECGAEQEAKP